MRRLLLAALVLVPLASQADECKYQAPRNLTLDLNGVREVQVDLHSHDLHLTGSDSAKGGTLTGRACASDSKLLDDLTVTQRREGDRLIVEAGGKGHMVISMFGHSYTDLDLNLQLPAQMPVVLNVGSGDAWVTGLQRLETQVGSGDLHVSKIAGPFASSVGSGDVDVRDVGSLDVGSIGSGDVKVDGIRGDARVGSVGSGDVTIVQVGGNVRVDTLGSGDLRVRDVRGDFSVGAKGSGDISHSGVQGKVNVPHDRDD
jgi:Putative adhesin